MYQRRRNIKPVLIILLVVVLLAAGIATWFFLSHVRAGGKFYPRNADVLDLRFSDITVEEYEKVQKKSPDSDILWRIPFQGKSYDQNTTVLSVSNLTDTDVTVLDYFTKLERVEAQGCDDYAQLAALSQRRPAVTVDYTVAIDGREYPQDAAVVTVSDITQEEIGVLQYLPELTAVTADGCGDPVEMKRLQEYCEGNGLTFSLRFGAKTYPTTAQELEVTGATGEELEQVALMPELKQLHLIDPEAPAEDLIQLRSDYPKIQITWQQEIAGLTFRDDVTEVDLSSLFETTAAASTTTSDTTASTSTASAPKLDLRELAEKMAYFPDAETLFLGKCGVDNEKLAAFREEKREEYKVAWTVQLGKKLTARTDDTTFMPVREHVYYFLDDDAYNLRYCEDMVCIDVGHMALTNIDFVAYMPHLKYLILAHNGQLQDISPISNCKELIFLELDWSAVKDFSPLVGCTALEDLNIGLTYPSIEPLYRMPWLKNLWMVERGATYELTQSLPDTKIITNANATVGAGWRNLQNYYDMRDLLGMEYMSG